jgi:acetylornithine deacetylase
MTVTELAKSLIDIPSTTGNEAKIAGFLADFLANAGFVVKKQAVSGDRCNLLATTADRPCVVLCTHMDTVPPFIPASEDDTYIYGRGACDTKGIMAAMLSAAGNLLQKGTTGFAVLLVIGEETDSIGAKTANQLEVNSDFIIVGEPTENRLGRGHKGIVAFEMSAQGKAAHSAYPELGDSALDKLLNSLERIRRLELPDDAILGSSSLNIGYLQGGVAHNVVAAEATAKFSIRNVRPAKEIIASVQALAGPGIVLEVLTQSEPQVLFTVPGFEQVVLSYCTDIPHLQRFGKSLLLGPGSIVDAHTAGERIAKEEMTAAIDIYEKLVTKLLDGGRTDETKSEQIL